MDTFDIPIFRKAYDLYRTFYGHRNTVAKQDRYTIWQRCENLILEIVEDILLASQKFKSEKIPILERISVRLNFLRVFLRLMKDVKTLDLKKYTTLEESIDEIGRMIGGWIKSSKAE